MAADFVAAVSVIMVFGLAGLVLSLLTYYLVQRERLRAGVEYRQLAEEAVRSNQAAVEEAKRMNETLKQIERVLSEA